MEKFANYILQERIHETRHSVVYRGKKEDEDKSVIIKVFKTKDPTPSEIARFRQEYNLVKNLDIDGIVKTYDLVEDSNRYAIIEEDFNGVSLTKLIESKKIDLKLFLQIAEKVSETLGLIHKNNVIHLDIKPDNILINTKQDIVKITDFGISSILTHANEELYNPEVIEGTLPYISPEQTGRMNRTVDYRTDMYSLGITFYEMLTGSVPFQSKDPMELIHSHIARQPAAPESVNSSIPSVISEIITKLLLKNPEERYQNAFGLAADIRECIQQLDEHGKIGQFEICRYDISNKFIIPIKIFGRKKEINVLLESFKKVTATEKGAAVMVVAGVPGIGKSTLVNELQKPIVASRGYFISGKYEQFRRDKPYSGIIQAFQALVKQILSESEEKIDVWKKELLNVLTVNGQVITEVIPEVELIIGKQSALPTLGPEESRNRFNFVFEKFMRVFPQKEHPIVLFLDDLQWVDLASLQLMRNILTSRDIGYLLLILSYRDNEVDDFHPVTEFLREDEKNNVPVGWITLNSLTQNDVKDLITNFLKCPDEQGAELAELVQKKTGGNPFFVNQFLHTLYNEKMIVLDGAVGWRWDMESIGRMQVTDNLVEMMAGKIGKLTSDAQELLKICACIGNRFDLETLASVGGTSVDRALSDLTEAIREGLVSRLGDNYIFHHDRIQEAAYSLMTDAEKSELHYKIGKLSLDSADETTLQKKLFYIVDQLNLGVNTIKSTEEREKLARLNLEAGVKAKTSAAYEPAFRYLKFGINLLEDQPWENQYEITLALYTESTEAAYLMGDYDTMNKLAEIALERAKTTLEKVKIFTSKINSCMAREDFRGAIDEALPALRLFTAKYGFRISNKPGRILIGIEVLKTMFKLLGKRPQDLVNLPRATNPEILAAGKILASVGHAAFYADPNLIALIILKSFRIMFRFGLTPEHAFDFAAFGIVLGAGLWDFERADEYGKLGLKLMEKLGARDQECRIIFVYNALVRHWKYPSKDSIEPLLEGYRIGLETGELDFASFNLFVSDTHHIFSGLELSELERNMERNNKIIAGLKQGHALTLQSITWQAILNLLGRCDNPLEVTGKAIEGEKLLPIWESAGNRAALSVYWFVKIIMCSLYNEYPQALKACDQYRKYMESQQGVLINKYAVLLDTIARLMTYKDASVATKIKHRALIRINELKMRAWAKSAPMNCLHMYHSMRAMYAWIIHGDIEKAENIFRTVIELCRKYEDFVVEGIADEIIARLFLSIGEEEKARHYIADAYRCYSKWGATGLINKLTKMYPDLAKVQSEAARETSTSYDSPTVMTMGTQTEVLDLATVIKTSQILSSDIDLGKLLANIMRLSIENAGAQHGFLIMENEKDQKLYILKPSDRLTQQLRCSNPFPLKGAIRCPQQ